MESSLSNSETDAVDIRSAVKRFGDFTALNNVSIAIRDNEFFTLLGPSGCGKTTLLRMIAGFEDITEGEILLFGEEIDKLPPNKRPVNTVFQNYALFPHLTVLENVSFGLEMLGNSKTEISSRAGRMLELVQLTQFADRKPAQLSGGQQQRVALARALAPQPKVLLLDEPLSALDLKLRKAMQLELKHLQKETGITFIFVTHDQEEALTMSDRIAVMSAGEIQQVDESRLIYERPRNMFVADFVGETNLLDATVESLAGDRALCRIDGGVAIVCKCGGGVGVGDKVQLLVRPERMELTELTQESEGIQGRVLEHIFIGTDITSIVEISNGPKVKVRMQNSNRFNEGIFEPGSPVCVKVESEAVQLMVN